MSTVQASRGATRGARRETSYHWLLGVGFVLLCLIGWELLARSGAVNPISFPPFTKIALKWGEMLISGETALMLGPTLARMFIGLAISSIIGITVGLLMGYFRVIYYLLEPVVEFLRPLPSPAYIPILILFVGIGDDMKVAVITIGTLFPILVSTFTGVRNMDVTLLDTARTLGVSAQGKLFRVVLPASLPYVFSGLRVSVAISLIMAVLSEMVAGNNGIGFHILNAQRIYHIVDMYANVISVGLLGYLLNRLFLILERRIVGWSAAFQKEES